MMTYLSYDIKVAVLIAVFYVFYRVLLCRETLHRMNRIVLLTTAALSFVLPLCIITIHRTEIIAGAAPLTGLTEGATTGIPGASLSVQPWWHTAMMVLYITGVATVICKILISLISILRLIRSAQDVREFRGSRLIISDTHSAPFSWMNYIIIGRDDYEQGIEEILEHEKAHIGLRHSWDLLLVDLISAIQWFNPAIWMLRSDIRDIHEYEADEAVLLKGVNVRHYQYLLVSKAMADSGFSITNQFNHSNLKLRINMMTKKKSSKRSALKALYILPVIGISLAVSARTIVDYRYEQPTKENQTVPNPVIPDDVVPTDICDKPEVMPEFQGGTEKLFEHMKNNLKYPALAEELGVQGRILVQFIISKDGKVYDPQVIKAINPKNAERTEITTKGSKLPPPPPGDETRQEKVTAAIKQMSDEAIRCINATSDHWTPAKNKGKTVNTKFVVPIVYRLK